MLASPEFRRLVAVHRRVTLALTLGLFVLYYGYILLLGWNRPLLAGRIGEHVTLGIPVGVGVIVLSWVLSLVYVVWANEAHDPEVRKLKRLLW